MRSILAIFILGLISTTFVSCNNEKNDEKPVVVKPDSSRINRTETKVNPYAIVDVSPMDISYFPEDYPILKMEKKISTQPLARVVYSRPHLQGRHLFKDLLKYGEPWRLGANESTELDLYTAADIMGKKIGAGRYVLYCLPQQDKWTIVLNTNIDSWGLKPDSTKDIARFDIPVNLTSNNLEYYTMVFQKNEKGAALLMAWDDVEAKLPISFPSK